MKEAWFLYRAPEGAHHASFRFLAFVHHTSDGDGHKSQTTPGNPAKRAVEMQVAKNPDLRHTDAGQL